MTDTITKPSALLGIPAAAAEGGTPDEKPDLEKILAAIADAAVSAAVREALAAERERSPHIDPLIAGLRLEERSVTQRVFPSGVLEWEFGPIAQAIDAGQE
jgi:hypothetical protein